MTLVDKLAANCGIEEAFVDALGKSHRTSAKTKQALLRAMGMPIDEVKAGAMLAQLAREEWLRPLPPVCVLYNRPGETLQVEVNLPKDSNELKWRLGLEFGEELSGQEQVGALPLIRRHTCDGEVIERRRLILPDTIPWGYHRLELVAPQAQTLLIITPGQCWLPDVMTQGQRLWGLAAQLYLLRSASNWGIGDFTDLCRLVELSAGQGINVVGLNPLHAMFMDDPEHASPYSPASRLLLNVLYIDVNAVMETIPCPEAQTLFSTTSFQGRLEATRQAGQVDYTAVAELKMQVLRVLFAAWRNGSGAGRQHEFERFRDSQGQTLERTCIFQALRQHFAKQDQHSADWHNWPAEYRDPDSAAVAEFARVHRDQVDFWVWLQWLADEQLAQAAQAAQGMAIGLYRDLAVGADRSGAETWHDQQAIVDGAQVGAPPDIYNPAGQDWGLPPFHPRMLRQEAYRSFIELVRANMRHAGGLRIDHVMSLQHLYWVPQGHSPQDGAYVSYPMEDMIGILALESQRQQCLVVGEDLGTVPAGFRERMAQANILSYRVLFFEQDGDTGAYIPPQDYPVLALAVAGSHDLPTLRGWWEGSDIELKERLHLYPKADEAARQLAQRKQDRTALLALLREQELLNAEDAEVTVEDVVRAVHGILARSAALMAIAQLDDITGEAEQVNVPSTSHDKHPNWRRRLSIALEDLPEHPPMQAIADLFNRERRRVSIQGTQPQQRGS